MLWRERTDWFPRTTRLGALLTGVRWGAVVIWAVALVRECWVNGVPFDREGLLLWMTLLAVAASIGYHPVWLVWVILDWLPFALVLVAYDYLRGLSDTLGMPTWWQPQIDMDRILFLGAEPTVWLQAHLKYPQVRWWDVVVCICYVSFFLLPYVTAGVLWLRRRELFHKWAARFVTLSFIGFALFTLMPAAPPWAAARCLPVQVASHPNDPGCMYGDPQYVPHGGLLGAMTHTRSGANPWVERISTRGWSELHLSVAKALVDKGQGVVDQVAAIPSLHLGGTMLFVLFVWKRVKKWARPLLAGYPVLMTFSLVYSGEHYLTDCVSGALLAWAVHALFVRLERRRERARAADTLEPALVTGPERPQEQEIQENSCPTESTTLSST